MKPRTVEDYHILDHPIVVWAHDGQTPRLKEKAIDEVMITKKVRSLKSRG